jgi:hypothetical protein
MRRLKLIKGCKCRIEEEEEEEEEEECPLTRDVVLMLCYAHDTDIN